MKIKRILIITFCLLISSFLLTPLKAEFVVTVEPEDEITIVFDGDTPEEPGETPAEPEEPALPEYPEEPVAPEEEPEIPAGDTIDLTSENDESNIICKKLVFDLRRHLSKNAKIKKSYIWFNRSLNENDEYYNQARIWIGQLPKKWKNSWDGLSEKTRKRFLRLFLKRKWSKSSTLNCKKGGYEWDITDDLQAEWDNGNEYYEINIKYYDRESLSKSLLVITCEDDDSEETGAVISAAIDINPKTINLKSRNLLISARIELPSGYSANDIDFSSVNITKVDGSLVEPVPADSYSKQVKNRNNNNTAELKVWFPRNNLKKFLSVAENVSITISGKLTTGEAFEGRAFINVIEPGRNKLLSENGGKITGHAKAGIIIPSGALDKVTEITITTNKETEEENINEVIESPEARDSALNDQGLEEIGEGCNFGPEGTQFNKPVLITLYYNKEELKGYNPEDLKIYYWNKTLKSWETLKDSSVDTVSCSVSACVDHFSLYQVLTRKISSSTDAPEIPGISASFELGEVYCYPSPARDGVNPVFHVEAGSADEVRLGIFNVTGNEIATIILDRSQAFMKNLKLTHEYTWDITNIASGIYIYTVTAEKEGFMPLRTMKKMGIIK